MIYITGDTHGDVDFEKLPKFFTGKSIRSTDYLIILGDAGIVWSERYNYINKYNNLGITILFIDGNHENFEMLNSFPVVEYCGAKCHKLAENIYHILRGEIITIDEHKFFCMGGATSIDKWARTNRVSWWEEENISNEDILNGLHNLMKVDFKVDYVLTHCAPSYVVRKMFGYDTDTNTKILEKFESQISFWKWFFGHYHEDKKWGRFHCVYNDIIELPLTIEDTIIAGLEDVKNGRVRPTEEVFAELHKCIDSATQETEDALNEIDEMKNNPEKYKRYQSFQDIINEITPMKKILVIGCPGSGKSYFSKKLSPLLVIPLYHIDTIYWKEDGEHITREELIKEYDKIFKKDSYILDGNYKSTLYYRINYSDTIFFFDLPKDVCMEGLKQRRNKYRDDVPKILSKKSIDGLIKAIENFDKDDKPLILEEFKKHPEVNVITFHSREEADAYLESLKERS